MLTLLTGALSGGNHQPALAQETVGSTAASDIAVECDPEDIDCPQKLDEYETTLAEIEAAAVAQNALFADVLAEDMLCLVTPPEPMVAPDLNATTASRANGDANTASTTLDEPCTCLVSNDKAATIQELIRTSVAERTKAQMEQVKVALLDKRLSNLTLRSFNVFARIGILPEPTQTLRRNEYKQAKAAEWEARSKAEAAQKALGTAVRALDAAIDELFQALKDPCKFSDHVTNARKKLEEGFNPFLDGFTLSTAAEILTDKAERLLNALDQKVPNV